MCHKLTSRLVESFWQCGLAVAFEVLAVLGTEVMGLAAAARDLGRGCVYRHQTSRKFDTPVDKRAGTVMQLGIVPNFRNVVPPCPRPTSHDCGR